MDLGNIVSNNLFTEIRLFDSIIMSRTGKSIATRKISDSLGLEKGGIGN